MNGSRPSGCIGFVAPHGRASVARRLRPGLAAACVGVLLATPSVVWASIDRALWPWDQAGYGIASIELWVTLRLDPDSWLHALVDTRVWRPPAIFWIGQFFVPLRNLVGSYQLALLLSVEVTLAVSLALLFLTGRRLARGRTLPALAGVLLTASAPLLVNLSHWYFVETVQTASVIWVLFIMVSAHRWHLGLTVAQLLAAISFGLLTKLTTPLYVAAPAAVALVLSLSARNETGRPRWWLEKRFVASAALAAALVFATAVWYARNFEPAWRLAEFSSTTPLYGPQASFLSRLSAWFVRFGDAVFLSSFDVALVAVLVAAAAAVAVRRRWYSLRESHYPWLVLAGCVGSAACPLLLLSSQTNTISRFLAPAIPAVGVGLVAVLRLLDGRLVSGLVSLLFAGQFALMTFQSFHDGLPARLVYSDLRALPAAKSALATELERVVQVTCPSTTSGKTNTVGADYPWLNQNTVSLLAAEEFAFAGRRCPWTSLAPAGTDAEAEWRDLRKRESPFFLTVDYGNPRNALPRDLRSQLSLQETFNKISPAILQRALRSGRYEVVPGSRRHGIVLLRLVKPTERA